MKTAISWPAMIQFEGLDELTLVADDQQWLAIVESFSSFGKQDRLIDSQGNSFQLDQIDAAQPLSMYSEGKASLERVNTLLQRHAAQSDQCCIGKIHSNSFTEVMVLLASLEE